MIHPRKRAKVMIPSWKRAKHANEDNQDRLSDLPDCVLLRILSSLDSKYAVRTCILSTRWKNLWKHVPTLILRSIKFSTFTKFTKFVCKILTLRDTSIALHALDIYRSGNIDPSLLKKIFKYVSSHSAQLQKLGISLHGVTRLTMSFVSSCRALTSLKLSLYPRIYNRKIFGETLFPKSLNLPLLTNLDLMNFTFRGGENGCAEPFSAFTKLNSLFIRNGKVKNAQILSISSATLVNLSVHFNLTDSDFDKIELSTPSLRKFIYTNHKIVEICGSGLSSVKQVNINAPAFAVSAERALVLLTWLQDLISVESLRVTSTTLQILSLVPDLLEVKLPSFCYLKKLEVELLPIQNGLYQSMQKAMLKKAAAKSREEADKLRKEFEAGLFPNPIPDGMVDFLRQNSPLAEVNLTTKYKGYFYLRQVEESKKGVKIIKSHSQFARPASSTAHAYGAESASAAAPPNFHLCHAEKDSQSEAIKHKEMLANELTCLREEVKKVTEDRDRIQGQLNAETCSSQKEKIKLREQKLRAEREKLEMADLSALETSAMFEEQKRIIRELRDPLEDKEFQIVEGEKLRKKLHNTVLELKGNIRVFCRVRPLLQEDRSETNMVVSYPASMEMLGRGIELVHNAGQKQLFTFDKVFNHGASQQEVFTDISQLVQSALDGYKVCIFAYGQTGSGKTYTMMGRPDTPDLKGMIPLSLEQIFQTSQSLKDQGWNFKMQASVLEIYNETIKDLLLSNRSSGFDQTRTENSVHGKQYTIRHDKNGNTDVLDLTIVDVCSADEISSLLHKAAQIRSMGRTQMNEQSSRSHFVVTLRICGINENTEQQVQGVLNLIDLAGSERLSRSGATGDSLKETQAINQSLSSLSNVIFALAKKEEHVPFTDSKLTHLLQPCLEGDSKTLMFVNISPDQSSIDESLCSLRFAARVNAVKLGFQSVRPRHLHGA